jgi:hypothetical protein
MTRQCARRAIAEAKQLWSVNRWVTKSLLSRAPSCFERHIKPTLMKKSVKNGFYQRYRLKPLLADLCSKNWFDTL